MGKSPSKKPTRSKKSQALENALKALEGKRHVQFVGEMDADGKYSIDERELNKLRKKLDKEGISKSEVRFIALNAPFMRERKPA